MNQEANKIKRVGAFEKRVHEIDFARGFLILLVLLDHFLNRILLDFQDLGGGFTFLSNLVADYYWNTPLRYIVQPLALASFCLVSGISTGFSKNNWKRSIMLLIVTVAIGFLSPRLGSLLNFGPIYFNVIGVLAVSSLIYCLVQDKSWKTLLGLALLFTLFTLYVVNPILSDIYPQAWNPYLYNENSIFIGIFNPLLYKPNPGGIPQSDYMPLFPYIVFFFIGAIISKIYYKDKKSLIPHLRRDFERPICFMGRHSLWFYAGHQIVMIPIFALIRLIVKG